MKEIDIPVVAGPGSQPSEEDGMILDYLKMPSDMTTYAMPDLPEADEVQGIDQALVSLTAVRDALRAHRADEDSMVVDLSALDEINTKLINQVLGSGEVSAIFESGWRARVQESVLAGVWRVQIADSEDQVIRDQVEVGVIPGFLRTETFRKARTLGIFAPDGIPEEAGNAAALLTEINDKLESYRPGTVPHVVNLTLLPHSEQDLKFFNEVLGTGPTVILSRGYGNCRITSTSTRNVWWVQYFNSQDTLILNTIEISDVPAVACAAREDIADSAVRLSEILALYQ